MASCQAVAQILFFKYCKLAQAQELQFFLLFTFSFYTEEFYLSQNRKTVVVVREKNAHTVLFFLFLFFFFCLTLSLGSISDEISRITLLVLNFKRIMSSPDA